MTSLTFSAAELAAELGRSLDWFYDNWPRLVTDKALPPPLHNGAQPLRWSRAQVYAVLDRALSKDQRAHAAAYRAALDAAGGSTREAQAIAASRARLDERFPPPGDRP